jgi:dolichol-phosphate mannosyltransferase
MSTYKLVSLILPVYNQGAHITRIVSQYSTFLSSIKTPYEMLIITNGCTDSSFDICQKLSQENPAIRVINIESGGWGLAVITGIAQAKGDLICYTNTARTGPQELALTLLYALSNPGVIIKANRKIRESGMRRFGSLLFNLECRAFFDLYYWDVNGTPKIFPRENVRLLNLQRTDDLIDLEFNIICQEEQYPVLEVPLFSYRRHGGKSTTRFGSAYKMYLGAFQMWLQRRSRPLISEKSDQA